MPNNQTYSTKNISPALLDEISASLHGKTYGSVEIYIQDSRVTQITERVITKLNSGKSTKNKDRVKLRHI